MAAIKVLVVDDHSLVRRGVVDSLSQYDELEMVGEASNGSEAVLKAAATAPDVIVMDLNMPVMGGVEATQHLKKEVPDVHVLILTVSEKETDLFSAMGAGARGYLLKDSSADELFRGVMHISEGGVLVSPSMASALLGQLSGAAAVAEGQTKLSVRETEVLQLVAEGGTNKEIGADLFISENTVKTHLRNIMDKLHLAKRSQAAAYAIRAGISRPGGPPTPGR